MSAPKAFVIVGPTAVGKTDLAVELAERLGRAEIVSADSRQIYRYMNIGTAKPTRNELRRVRHHFIDIRNPNQEYSAGEYGREARACIDKLHEQDIIPVIAGGSGFYIQALIDGLFAPKISDQVVKEMWRERIRDQGRDAVFEHLRQVDPLSAARLHPNDTQRVVRALEVYDLTGVPVSEYRRGREEPCDFEPVFFGITMERERLYSRIDERVLGMVQAGLVDEVKSLQERGWGPDLNALRTVGYQEVFDYLDGKYTQEEMVETIQRNTRRYAKRQLTWFRKDERIQWIDLDRNDSIVNQMIDEFEKRSLE